MAGTGLEQSELRLGAFIRERRRELIEEWEQAIRRLPKAEQLGRMRRIDHLPEILDRIAEVADSEGDALAEHLASAPDVHALERLDEGFELSEVIREYALLRTCVLRRWEREVVARPHPEDLVALDRAFDEAIQSSVARFTQARDRTLQSLDRITSAALGARSRGDLLQQLVQVFVETSEAVDSSSILLVEGDRMVMRAQLGVVVEAEAPSQGPSGAAERGMIDLPLGEGIAGEVWRSGQPVLLHSAATDARTKWDALRREGTRALYAVPLVAEGATVGVAHMASRTAWDFSEEDKLLFRTMVVRATDILVQAELRDRIAAERRGLEAVLRQVPTGVLLVDREARLLLANAEAEAILGAPLRPGGALPQEVAGLVHHPTEGREVGADELAMARALRGETVRGLHQRLRVGDGRWKELLVNAAPVLDERGAITMAVVTFADETVRVRSEQLLVEEAAYRERFIGILGHDLRGPLMTILASSGLLLRRSDLADAARRVLRRIDASAQRMGRMIGDLLDLTRSRSGGGLPLQRAPVDLADVVRQVVDELAIAHPDRRIELTVEGDAKGEFDGERAAQAFANVVGNAIEHGPPGSPVRVSLRGEPDEVAFAVHNEGPPIPEALRPRLFDPFVRGQAGRAEARPRQGLGLGLFIAREVVVAHGGSIAVASTADEGTTFTLRWPRRA